MNSLEKKLKELNDSVNNYERSSRKRAFIYSLVIPTALLTFYLGFIIWQISRLEYKKNQLEQQNSILKETNVALIRERENLTAQIIESKEKIENTKKDLKALNTRVTKIKNTSDRQSIEELVSDVETKVANLDSQITNTAQSLERYQKTKCSSIIDNTTGLEWFIGPDRNTTWDESRNWVKNLSACGGGWRLPKMEEFTKPPQDIRPKITKR